MLARIDMRLLGRCVTAEFRQDMRELIQDVAGKSVPFDLSLVVPFKVLHVQPTQVLVRVKHVVRVVVVDDRHHPFIFCRNFYSIKKITN